MNIAFYQQRLEQKLSSFFSSHTPTGVLKQAIEYSALAGGKRFRPILVYLVAECIQKNSQNQADNPACAIEMMHIYSLIHDDLPAMDDDDLRHHKPSCHIACGEAMAILAGDGLQTLAFSMLANHGEYSDKQRLAMLKLLSKHAWKMVYGQALDLDEPNQTTDLDYLKKMHRNKTGALLRCAVGLGAIVANADDDLISKFDDFAQYFGLAYQIQDDVLDVLNSTELLGKQQGSDQIKGKSTYVTLLGLRASKDLFVQNYDHAIAVLNNINLDTSDLKTLVLTLKNRQY